MTTENKRKSPPLEDGAAPPATKRKLDHGEDPAEIMSSSLAAGESEAVQKARERQDRFKALQARQTQSRTQNRKEIAAESQRLSTDPNLLHTINRKRAIATHKLLKADAAAEGEDFERKRAWDWTIDEAEKWDRRMEKKEKHRQDVAFQDYRQDARKVYKRQIQALKPDLDAYEKEKANAIQRAAENGSLEVVETEDGELVAVDKDGIFYSTANSTDFVHNKPGKEAVDRLVNDLNKAEEVRMRKRKERGKDDDDGDVTYINDKNKQFNLRLARAYNKYTSDIRESFERGTAI